MNKSYWVVVIFTAFLCASCGGSQKSQEQIAVTTPPASSPAAAPAAGGSKDAPAASQNSAKESTLAITEIRKEDGGKYSATLNGAIVFKALELQKGADGKEKLFFPKTPGKGGKEFPIVKLEDLGIADQIKAAIRDGKATGKAAPASLKVTEVRWKASSREGKLKGFADVTFNNAIEVKGCKLLEGKSGLWVAWPSVKKGDEYDDLIFALDKGVREMVEAAVKKEAGL